MCLFLQFVEEYRKFLLKHLTCCAAQMPWSGGEPRGRWRCGSEFPSRWADAPPPPRPTASPSTTPGATTPSWPCGWERARAGCRGLRLTKSEWQVESFIFIAWKFTRDFFKIVLWLNNHPTVPWKPHVRLFISRWSLMMIHWVNEDGAKQLKAEEKDTWVKIILSKLHAYDYICLTRVCTHIKWLLVVIAVQNLVY